MIDSDPVYVAARRVLLDALMALTLHRMSLVLVGAQAIYLRTQDSRINASPYTTDADLAINPRLLLAEPELEGALRSAGFRLEPADGRQAQPGMWWKEENVAGTVRDVEVDLMVPAGLLEHGATDRAARLADHSRLASRLTAGLEATLIDFSTIPIAALEPDDHRIVDFNVAGEASLLVAKLYKLTERLALPGVRGQRLDDKDAGDVVRLLLSTTPERLATRLAELGLDDVAGPFVRKAIGWYPDIFGGRRTSGVSMATRSLENDLEAEYIAQVCDAYLGPLQALFGDR